MLRRLVWTFLRWNLWLGNSLLSTRADWGGQAGNPRAGRIFFLFKRLLFNFYIRIFMATDICRNI
ncbi:MAG: hypothetical protein LBG87_00355 [Spirochaetaceae bacterium]|nr:hypothetical protein [Spirochaetaceae bacterium]